MPETNHHPECLDPTKCACREYYGVKEKHLTDEELAFIEKQVREHVWAIGLSGSPGNLLARLLAEHRALKAELSTYEISEEEDVALDAGLAYAIEKLREDGKEQERVKATSARWLELLREVEWVCIGHTTICPACIGYRDRDGHAPDCRLKREIDDG